MEKSVRQMKAKLLRKKTNKVRLDQMLNATTDEENYVHITKYTKFHSSYVNNAYGSTESTDYSDHLSNVTDNLPTECSWTTSVNSPETFEPIANSTDNSRDSKVLAPGDLQYQTKTSSTPSLKTQDSINENKPVPVPITFLIAGSSSYVI